MNPSENPATEFDLVEIRLFTGRVATYRVEMRMAADRVTAHLGPLPQEELRSATTAAQYGERLSEWLFHEDLREAFRRARWATESYARQNVGPTGLRVRLWIEPDCLELFSVMWETLCDPDRRDPLALTTALSRVVKVTSPPGCPRDRPLRLLLITSNPVGLSRFDLTSFDVELERRLVQSAVGVVGRQIQVTRLGPQVTIEDIRSAEKDGVHITHLVAHAVREGECGYVLLADEGGTVSKVACEQLAEVLVPTSFPPALVYIATPTERDGAAREAPTRLELGRMLLEAGVQAVVVIQAPMEYDRLALFTERFYSVLIQTGSVDQAMADARVAIFQPEAWDWAYPVLMMNANASALWAPELGGFEAIITGIRVSKV